MSVRPRPFKSWKVVFCRLRAQLLKQEMLRLLLFLGAVDGVECPLGPWEDEQHRMQGVLLGKAAREGPDWG